MLRRLPESSSWRDGGVALAQGSQPHVSGVSTIAVEHRRCRLAVVGGNDGSITIHDVRDLSKPPVSVVRSAPSRLAPGATVLDKSKIARERDGGHEGRVEAAAWLPDDDLLFVTGGDEVVKIWDASAPHECVVTVELHAQVRAATVTQAPKAVAAVALGDATARLIDIRTGRAVNTLQGHSAAVMCLSWDDAGSHRLFSGGLDGTVRAWDIRMGARSLFLCDPYAKLENRPLLKRAEQSEEELQRRQNPFGRAGQAGQLKLREIRFDPYRPTSMSPNTFLGSHNAREGHTGQMFDGAPQLANSKSAPASPPRRPERDKLRDDLWSADPTERARHALEPQMREYEHEACVAHRGAVISLAVVASVGGGRLLSCGVDGKLRIWDASTGAPTTQSPNSLQVESWSKPVPLQLAVLGPPEDVCFLPEGDRISVRCLRTGDLLCGLAAHTQEVQCASVLPGRGLLFTGGNDGRLLKWRLESNTPAEDIICLESSTPSKDVICLD